MTTFKAHNGDTLDELHRRKREVEERLRRLREEERVLLAMLRPVKESISTASSELASVLCRLDVWRAEFDASRAKVGGRQ